MGQERFSADGYSMNPAKDAPQTAVPGAGKFTVGSEDKKAQFGFNIKTSDGKTQEVRFGTKK